MWLLLWSICEISDLRWFPIKINLNSAKGRSRRKCTTCCDVCKVQNELARLVKLKTGPDFFALIVGFLIFIFGLWVWLELVSMFSNQAMFWWSAGHLNKLFKVLEQKFKRISQNLVLFCFCSFKLGLKQRKNFSSSNFTFFLFLNIKQIFAFTRIV